jgi:HK97 family phage major capsid protein
MPGLAKSKELREERANLSSRLHELVEAAEKEKRNLSAEERTEFDRIDAEQDALKTEIEKIETEEREDLERANRARKLKLELSDGKGTRAGQQDRDGQDDEQDDDAEARDQKAREKAEDRAFERWLRYGSTDLTPEERTIMSRRRDTGDPERRAQGTNVDTAGGYLVTPTFANRIVEAMKFFGGMRRARTFVFSTDTGAAFHVPTNDGTGNLGTIIPENPGTAVSEQDEAFGQVRLDAYTYSSKMVKVSIELLQDSAFDIPGFISRKLGERIARATNPHFTTGDAVNKPQGVVTAATLGKTGASTTAVTFDELIDLEHSVDIAYRDRAEWMCHDFTVREMKQLKDGNGRYLWLPGTTTNSPDTILGYPYVVNNDVAQMASSAKSILFGDFSNYWIRDVRGVTVVRLNERFIDQHQIAFLAFSRHDGGLVDAGQNPIKFFANA